MDYVPYGYAEVGVLSTSDDVEIVGNLRFSSPRHVHRIALECARCGAVVVNYQAHDAWHARNGVH